MLNKLTTWVFLALACNFIVRIVLLLDWNKHVYRHMPGPCKEVEGIVDGAEDIELLRDGSAIVSSGLRLYSPESKDAKGRLFLVDLKPSEGTDEPPKAVELEIKSKTLTPSTFNPHGISAWTSREGRVNLYVINHGADGDSVECFTFSIGRTTINHVKTIKDPLIYNANDLAAVGPERFYLSNDHYFKSKFLRKIEAYLLLNLGNVIYFDGHKARVVDSWLLTPNGVAVDENNANLYVASPLGESVRVYDVGRDDSVTKVSEISMMSSPDNIFVTEVGEKDKEKHRELFIACHPIAHLTIKHLENPKSAFSPSQVIRVRPAANHSSWTMTEPFVDDGRILSGSSVAVYAKEQLLIGSVHHKLLWCPVPDQDML